MKKKRMVDHPIKKQPKTKEERYRRQRYEDLKALDLNSTVKVRLERD